MDDEEIFDDESEDCMDMSDEFADVMGERQRPSTKSFRARIKEPWPAF